MKHVFFWKNKCWLITDESSLGHIGFRIYESTDEWQWKPNNTIMEKRAKQNDLSVGGLYCRICIVEDRAYILYHSSLGKDNLSAAQSKPEGITVAELELVDGKVVCKNDNWEKIAGTQAVCLNNSF